MPIALDLLGPALSSFLGQSKISGDTKRSNSERDQDGEELRTGPVSILG